MLVNLSKLLVLEDKFYKTSGKVKFLTVSVPDWFQRISTENMKTNEMSA